MDLTIPSVFWRVWRAPRATMRALISRGVSRRDWAMLIAAWFAAGLVYTVFTNLIGAERLSDRAFGNEGEGSGYPGQFVILTVLYACFAFVAAVPGPAMANWLAGKFGASRAPEAGGLFQFLFLLSDVGANLLSALSDVLLVLLDQVLPASLVNGFYWLSFAGLISACVGIGAFLAHEAFRGLTFRKAIVFVGILLAVMVALVLVLVMATLGIAHWSGWLPLEIFE